MSHEAAGVLILEVECWQELRDERGKLCARLDARRLLLELHRNHEWVVFDLRDYLYEVQRIDTPIVLR